MLRNMEMLLKNKNKKRKKMKIELENSFIKGENCENKDLNKTANKVEKCNDVANVVKE